MSASRFRPAPKIVDGEKRCAYAECYAPLPAGRKSPYCHDDHSAAARRRRTLELQAHEAAQRVYEAAINRLTTPHAPVSQLQHIGWFRTTAGVALSGDYSAELRLTVRDAYDALFSFGEQLEEGRAPLRVLQKTYRSAWPKFHALTEQLNRVLPAPQPNDR